MEWVLSNQGRSCGLSSWSWFYLLNEARVARWPRMRPRVFTVPHNQKHALTVMLDLLCRLAVLFHVRTRLD